ncbi:DUF3533 domain-containing protein [Blastococcus sp. TF02A-26]|uniref:DUF3533 domain-containing protein n=1 Tax=Blastococcus sp. TF02A-26 TaxID=2250577 RepID=UPI0018F57830|nr:DUF3533 domain-containing protein [Blastococcus sp. TF02A-26]
MTRPGAPGPARTGTVRTAVLVLGVLLLQLGFVLSYIGAFHSPTPREVPLAVVLPAGAPADAAGDVVDALNGIDGSPLDARAVADEAAGRDLLADREVDGVLLLGAGTEDRLLVAGAEGGALGTALETVLERVDATQQRTVTTEDVLPADEQDTRGLSPFYLAVGWVVGGYLVAAIIGVASGPATTARAAAGRLGGLAAYAVASGVGGALVAGPLLGALDGPFPALSALGALVVFGVGVFTMALQGVLGLVGVGVAILLFVVLGNPSAGGAYPGPLLPPFWAAIGPWLPPGAGTDAVRALVYFDGTGAGQGVLVLAGYAVAGVLGSLLAAGRGASSQVTSAVSTETAQPASASAV